MKSARKFAFLAATGIALWLAGSSFFSLFSKPKKLESGNSLSPILADSGSKSPLGEKRKAQPNDEKIPESEPMEKAISLTLAKLTIGGGDGWKKSNQRELERLRAQLVAAKIDAATVAILSFLRSGRDCPTGLDFVVVEGGLLESAPTLRMMLLDQLARIDPVAAGNFSQELLSRGCAPCESSLALRNLHWASSDAGAEALFRESTLRHISNDRWAESPEAGYLEGYDAAVQLDDPIAVGILARRASGVPNNKTTYASQLALERLAAGGNPSVLHAIAECELPARFKAEILARADLRDQEQRAVLESFLLDPSQNAAHGAFLLAFPMASHSSSPRLITEESLPTGGDQLERDRAALKAAKEWMAEQRFAAHQDGLDRAQKRLEDFLATNGQ